jgi:hypothetical protein
MLEMGINKFSIYSNFGNKNGVFLSLALYKVRFRAQLIMLKCADDGITGLKQYFYDFVEFTKRNRGLVRVAW